MHYQGEEGFFEEEEEKQEEQEEEEDIIPTDKQNEFYKTRTQTETLLC
jgi:hypothetical protein